MLVCSDLIFTAILGKYSVSKENFLKLSSMLPDIHNIEDLNNLNNQLNKVNILENDFIGELFTVDQCMDVLRQLTLCEYIHKILYRHPLSKNTLFEIHQFLFNINKPLYRVTNNVSDYGGRPPVNKNDVVQKFELFNIWCVEKSKETSLCKQEHSEVLVDVYSRYISIHPFEDGNGRIARFICFYFSLRWGYKAIIVPKMRNDRVWKEALQLGVKGDNFLLRKWFLAHLQVDNSSVKI